MSDHATKLHFLLAEVLWAHWFPYERVHTCLHILHIKYLYLYNC